MQHFYFYLAVYMAINHKANQNDTSVIEKDSTDLKVTASFEQGVTYELCAGIVDQKIPLIEIAKKEVLEETGYDVPLENISKLFQNHEVGFVGNRLTVFYAEVTDEMDLFKGGSNITEGEFIETMYLPLNEAKDFVFNDDYVKPSSFVAAFCWYFMKHGMK